MEVGEVPSKKERVAFGASIVVKFPSMARKKMCAPKFGSKYQPTINLCGAIATGKVAMPAPGASNDVMVPSAARTKPCVTKFASKWVLPGLQKIRPRRRQKIKLSRLESACYPS